MNNKLPIKSCFRKEVSSVNKFRNSVRKVVSSAIPYLSDFNIISVCFPVGEFAGQFDSGYSVCIRDLNL